MADYWMMRGQFGPAGEVKHDWSKCNYVTEEGELLQGTAIIKEGSYVNARKVLGARRFPAKKHRDVLEMIRSFEGCFNQGEVFRLVPRGLAGRAVEGHFRNTLATLVLHT